MNAAGVTDCDNERLVRKALLTGTKTWELGKERAAFLLQNKPEKALAAIDLITGRTSSQRTGKIKSLIFAPVRRCHEWFPTLTEKYWCGRAKDSRRTPRT